MRVREKTKKLVATFSTTSGAMAMEKACRAKKVPGRLIPVPRSITAGCGMCWMAPTEARSAVETLVITEHLDVDGFFEVLI